MSFWQRLGTPIFALAPMADVTDPAFRRIIATHSKSDPASAGTRVPYVTWTEFISADGLALAPEEGRAKLMADLAFNEIERPIVAQFFTATPLHMERAAALARELGFDGVDINMGCPDKSIERQGAGAAHMRNPSLAQEVIAAAKQGARDVPVSVKTRLGYNKDELEEWLPKVLAAKPAAITVHARTRKELSLVPARWERVKRAVEIRNEILGDASHETRILGNGDLMHVRDAMDKIAATGADGAMLGRAIFGNPWLFAAPDPFRERLTLEKRFTVMVEHTKLYEELLPHKSFAIMRKHYKAYVSGFDGAADLRANLMLADSALEVRERVNAWLAAHPELARQVL
ncbi:tRNA-dihydrouridine synthase [Patescibacteria group bacterium]|nr:tRNA-dihydrouridine synthase [Patescibacteria group bacterium]